MSTKLFQQFLQRHNLDIQLETSDKATTTAEEAAEVHGVPVSNIVKSLLVYTEQGYFLYLCPGDRRLDFEEIKRQHGATEARMATADEVKEVTGHSIGGVPPFGHKQPFPIIILDGFDPNQPLWAAAGASDTNFKTNRTYAKLAP